MNHMACRTNLWRILQQRSLWLTASSTRTRWVLTTNIACGFHPWYRQTCRNIAADEVLISQISMSTNLLADNFSKRK